ncbi:MAG: histidinol dehydrogenase [Candidatus Woesearchaeota archaeon]
MKEQIVKNILEDIKKNGDKAINYYSKKFDKEEFYVVTKKQINDAYKKVDKKIIKNLRKAAKNISLFSKLQFKQIKSFKTTIDNNILGQKIIPIENVGCYVPGGRYPLPSSALMSIIPAKIAGVKNIIVCSPKIQPITIVAADIAGANKIISVGGIQAIGGLTYGTKKIPKVDKIVGPGNSFVTEAKRQVYGEVGIDFIAGPSEILIIADKYANPDYIAIDILAQAEHDPEAKTYLVSNSKKLVTNVKKNIKIQINNLNTKDIAKKSIKNLKIKLLYDTDKIIEYTNKIAPEHLELQIKKPELIIDKLVNYGSLFIGKNSAEVFGDYCSGTNHILPTNKASRYTGGLSVYDFIKILTFQKITEKGKNNLIEISCTLAKVEGLDAHKKSAEIRLK